MKKCTYIKNALQNKTLFFTFNNNNNNKSISQSNFIPLILPDQHKSLMNNLSRYLISAAALLWYCHFLRETFPLRCTDQLTQQLNQLSQFLNYTLNIFHNRSNFFALCITKTTRTRAHRVTEQLGLEGAFRDHLEQGCQTHFQQGPRQSRGCL